MYMNIYVYKYIQAFHSQTIEFVEISNHRTRFSVALSSGSTSLAKQIPTI